MNSRLPQKNTFYFDINDDLLNRSAIIFTSAFDSGNLQSVDQYVVHTAPDVIDTNFSTILRSWFYFSVQCVPKGLTLSFVIKRINILYTLFRAAPETYKPVFKIGDGPWRRLDQEVKLVEDLIEKSIDVYFEYTFGQKDSSFLQSPDGFNKEAETFFAFSYPFSYQESQDLVNQLQKNYSNDPEIYFHHEVLTRSPQKRKINLLMISSHDSKLPETESCFHTTLFPFREQMPRPQKFAANKPIVLFTARVHPGEAPSSHSMNGILKFLLDRENPVARLLRQHFVFMIIPMVNPDGVYHGYYRLDVFGQNLNRHYRVPEYEKQPATYAIRKLVQHLHSENRLFFYVDLHSHAGRKGCFLYGNALNFGMQVETLVFSKLISLNSTGFDYEQCNFSKKHMTARDKGEKLTKEGAARVCVYRICNIIHSYTLECGFHYYTKSDKNKSSIQEHQSITNESFSLNIESVEKEIPIYYTIEAYEEIGRGLLVSILDIFEKNPYTELSITKYGDVQSIRNEIALNLQKTKNFDASEPLRPRCPSLAGVATRTFYKEVLRENAPKKPIEGLSIERRSLAISQISYKPTKSVEPYLKRSTRETETSLNSKIDDLLTEMTTIQLKTGEGNTEPEEKIPKLRNVTTPRRLKTKKAPCEFITICNIGEKNSARPGDETRRMKIPMNYYWDSNPPLRQSTTFEPIMSEEPRKPSCPDAIERLRDSRNYGRMMTHRGQDAKDQSKLMESPRVSIDYNRRDHLPMLNQFTARPKIVKKKNFLKPLLRVIAAKEAPSKKVDNQINYSGLRVMNKRPVFN